MRLYSPVSPIELAGNVNMIEKLVLGGTGTEDLPNRAVDGPGFQRAGPCQVGPGRHSLFTMGRAGPNIITGRAGPGRTGIFRPVTVFY